MSIEYSRTERPPLPSRRKRREKIDRAEKNTRRTTARAEEAQAREISQRNAKRKGSGKRNWVSTILLIVGLSLMAFALWQLGQIWWKYYSANKNYSALSSQFTTPVEDNNGDGADDAMLQAARERIIDFEGLKAINPDIVAWIYIPDSRIDYPVLFSGDNDFYLKADFEKNFSDGGAVFLDMFNNPDFNDLDSRIYGHNMYDGSMFGQLPRYRKPDFAKTHEHVFLYTPVDTREYLLIDQGLITADGLYPVGEVYDGAQFLTLVTCEYDFDDARYFIRTERAFVYKPGGEKIWPIEVVPAAPEDAEVPPVE